MTFDIIIKNGVICDGTGAPSYNADIGITGNIISYIGDLSSSEAGQIIDAAGKTVTPGFIDPHTHVDMSLFIAPQMEPYLKQGVTTVVTGNCGHGSAPSGKEIFYGMILDSDYLDDIGADDFDLIPLFSDKAAASAALEKRFGVALDWSSFGSFLEKCSKMPLGCNVASLIGYNAVRTSVMGKDCLRAASAEEIKKLSAVTKSCMEEGAFGFSTGRDPFYKPGPYVSDDEAVAMLKIVARYDGIFASHTYNYNKDGLCDRIGGYEEMLRQAKAASIRANVSHVHVMGMAQTPEGAERAAEETIAYFDRMKSQGVDLSYDVIPTPMSTDFTLPSVAYHIKPLVLMSGSRKRLAKNLKLSQFRDMIRAMASGGPLSYMDEYWFEEMTVLSHKNQRYAGKSLLQCADEMGLDPLDAFMDIFIEDPFMAGDMVAPSFSRAVEILMNHEGAMPCSDGCSYPKELNQTGNDEIPVYLNSPNISYIPRFLTHYCLDNFEEAVHRASGLVADRFNIKNRGKIKTGNFADITILDRSALHSFDEDENPLQDPLGIELVLVNGQIAVKDGVLTGRFAGEMLRKNR